MISRFWFDFADHGDGTPPADPAACTFAFADSRTTGTFVLPDLSVESAGWDPLALPEGVSLYVPEHYEPNYAYPLLIWLHDAPTGERELRSLMTRISGRNYFGLAMGGSGSVARRASVRLQERLFGAVTEVRRHYNIHTERIYPAGFGRGANVALSLFLERPEWFAGAAPLGLRQPVAIGQLKRLEHLRGKRILLGVSDHGAGAASEIDRLVRLLHTAGLEITLQPGGESGRINGALLNALNHWVMGGICTAV